MLKKIINSSYFTWFRKSFLRKIYNEISIAKHAYCCNVITWHKLFICWKNLKEVKENMSSNTLILGIKEDKSLQHCGLSWFHQKKHRLEFLNECLEKFK